MRRTLLLLGGLAVAATAGAGAGRAAAPPPVGCVLVDATVATQTADHLLCVDLRRGTSPAPGVRGTIHVIVRTSDDSGRTWHDRAGQGLPEIPEVCEPPQPSTVALCPSWGTSLSSALHSTGYLKDKALYIGLHEAGLFRSTDDGSTWELVSLAGREDPWSGHFTAFHDPTTPAVGTGEINGSDPLAYVNSGTVRVVLNDTAPQSPAQTVGVGGPERIDPPVSRTALGTGDQFDLAYQFPRSPYRGTEGLGVGFSFGQGPGQWDFVNKSESRLHRCTYQLDCRPVTATFAPGKGLTGVALTGDFGASGIVLASTVDWPQAQQHGRVVYDYWRVTTGGTRITPWPAMRKLQLRARQRGGEMLADFGTSADRAGEVDVLAYNWCNTKGQRQGNLCPTPANPPAWEVFTSHDDGTTLTRTAAFSEPGRASSLPRPAWTDENVGGLTVAPHGRLFLVSWVDKPYSPLEGSDFQVPQHSTLWCSVDSGRTWSSPCAR